MNKIFENNLKKYFKSKSFNLILNIFFVDSKFVSTRKISLILFLYERYIDFK